MPRSGSPREDGSRDAVRASSQFLGHGMALAASVGLFGWGGWQVGERVGAQSLLMLLGMLLGGAAGGYHLYHQLVVRPREKRDREESEAD